MWADFGDAASGWDGLVVGAAADGPVTPDAVSEAHRELASLRQSMRPLRDQDILQELAKLSVKVAKRAEDGFDLQVRLEGYTEELRQFPGDLVLDVLRRWPRMSRFWPAWSELQLMLERRLAQRKGMMAALEKVAQREAAAA